MIRITSVFVFSSLLFLTLNLHAAEDNIKKADATLDQRKASGLIKSNWGQYFNITRLQARTTPGGRTSFLQATFIRFPAKLFLAQSFEYTKPFGNDPAFTFSEVYGGGPVVVYPSNPKLYGWVARLQSGSELKPQYSFGGQYNIGDHIFLEPLKKKRDLTMFIQVFPLKNDYVLGSYDILHYYSLTLYKKLYVRGYNRIFVYYGEEDYLLSLQDIVYPFHQYLDGYTRHTYQNRSDIQYGREGSEWSFGVRINISI